MGTLPWSWSPCACPAPTREERPRPWAAGCMRPIVKGHQSQAILMPETWSSQHKRPPARGQGNGPRGARLV